MIQLFHGSDVSVENPKVEAGRAKVDFGRGFYLSSLLNQAKSWAKVIASRTRHGKPVLNCYDFDEEMAKNMSGARYKVFKSYDMDWLNYVIDCRRGGELQLQYDVVEGGVANDNVIDTVEDYENGIITAEQALGQLVYKNVNHQICIRSQKVVDACLKFTGSEIL
jgi:hypothetical protein